MSATTSISMPSMTARKSSALEIEFAHRLRQPAKVLRRRAAIERVEVGTPLLQVACDANRAGRDRRRCHRPRGRTNRFRTSPRAARAAGCASPCRTSCRRRVRPLVGGFRSLSASRGFCDLRQRGGRAGAQCAPSMPRMCQAGDRRYAKDARVRSADRAPSRMWVRRCARVLITATSSARRRSTDQNRKNIALG